MNSAKEVAALVEMWKSHGAPASEIVMKGSDACLGWPYCWGAVGIACTVANRKRYMANTRIASGDAELIRKRCQVLNGKAASCTGCKYLPGGELVDMNDCIGFVKERFKAAGINITSNGCTLAWNNSKLWTKKGSIKEMPNVVCCVFQKDPTNAKKMQHIGIHVGNGRIVHCSGEVKEGKITDKGWTDYAIPKGIEGGDEPVPIVYPTLRKGSKGEYVTLLQTKLIQRGYSLDPFGADGSYGNVTVAAVRMFQRDNGLADDGICGSKTWSAIMDGAATTFTVRIEHVSRSVAEEIVKKFGGTMTAEEV